MLVGIDLIKRLRGIPHTQVIAIIVNVRIGLLPFYSKICSPFIIYPVVTLVFKIGAEAVSAFLALFIIR